jgi:hypothetical protein
MQKNGLHAQRPGEGASLITEDYSVAATLEMAKLAVRPGSFWARSARHG